MSQIRWPVPSHTPRSQSRVTQIVGALEGSDDLTPSSIERSRAIGGSPSVNPSIAASAISRERAQGTPTVSSQTLPAALERLRAQGTITVTGTMTVTATGLSRTRALGALATSPQLLPASLERTRALGDLSFTELVVIPKTIRAIVAHTPKQRRRVSHTVGALEPSAAAASPASLERTRELGTLSLFPSPASITRTRALGTISVSIPGSLRPSGLTSDGPGIPLLLGSAQRQRTLGAAQVAAPLPASLVRTRVTFAPRIDPKLVLTGIEQTRAIGSTATIGGATAVGLERSRALGSNTLNPSIVPNGLVQTRVLSATNIGEPGATSNQILLLLRGVG